jgi:hypothetical protein
MTVSWTGVAGANFYNVYYGTGASLTIANGIKLTGVNPGLIITGLAVATPHFFIVTATNDAGESAASTTVSATTGGTVANTAIMGGAIQNALTLTGAVSTIAGTANSTVPFYSPYGATTDGKKVYVTEVGNCLVWSVDNATGVIATLAGNSGKCKTADGTGTSAYFTSPRGITTDGTNLYVADNLTIRKVVIATGVVTTLAGSATFSGVGSADGTGPAAKFNGLSGITTDGTNLYVADNGNFNIRKVVIATGVVTTLAGSAGVSGSTDGTGTAAKFNQNYGLNGLTTDGTNLYVVDGGNHTIRKVVIATGVVTTIAGSAGVTGTTDGTGTAARFNNPSAVTMDGTNLYVTDAGNQIIRQMVIATGAVTTIAGVPWTPSTYGGNGDGTGTAARFHGPFGVTTDGKSLFVVDSSNNTIRKIQ